MWFSVFESRIHRKSHNPPQESICFPCGGDFMIYVVKNGDTMEKISNETQIPVQKIISDNQLIYSDRLVPGQALLLLGEGETGGLGDGRIIGRYAYPFVDPPVLEEALTALSEMLMFSYGFTFEGNLVAPMQDDQWMIERTKSAGAQPWMVLTPLSSEGAFNNQLIKVLMENQELQDRLIEQMLIVMQEKGYEGLDIDFEYILPENREQYAQFAGRAREKMNEYGYKVTVAVAPKISNSQRGILVEGVDYALLGQNADAVFLMTYEWGYTYGPPMAVAPLDKVREVVEYAVTQIQPEQLILGIPNYGYDWTLPYERGISRARSIGNVEAVEIAAENGATIEYAQISQSPWFTYRKNGMEHVVWFEDVRSITAKWELVREMGLSGARYWNLMRPFRANWLLVR